MASFNIETSTVTFSSETSKTYTFSQTYASTPVVVATTNGDDFNVFIDSVSKTQAVISTSSPYQGEVYIQVISEKTS